MKKLFSVFAAALFFVTAAYGQNPGNVTNHAFAIGKGPTIAGYTSLLCGAGQLAVAQAGADPICRTVSGDWTLNAAGVATLATVNANVGTFGSATQCITTTQNAKGLTTAMSAATCTPAVGSITGLGTGVAAALANNIGSAGAVVVFNGAGGTPSAIALANGTGLPIGTGVAGLGTGVATALAVNTGSAGAVGVLIARGTSALGTGAITSATCATVVTTAATNTATTDIVTASFNGDPTAVTGYIPSTSGMLTIFVYPTANNVNFKVCNNTASSITPGAITLNWRVAR